MGAFTSAGTENQMRWDRSSGRFMEVWYATLTHRRTGTGVWVRYTIDSPKSGEPTCALWAFAFDRDEGPIFAGKQTFEIGRLGLTGRDDGALVRIGDAWLSESALEGEVEGESDSMSWSLEFDPSDRCFRHIPEPLSRRVERRISTVCSPNHNVPFRGAVKVAGRVLEFDGDRGTQSHRWGRAHASTWAWSHCSAFDTPEPAVFEAVSARSSVGPLAIPTSTFAYLQLDGEDLLFNSLKWALRARSSYEMPTWAFSTNNGRYKVVGATRVDVRKLVQVTYTDPDDSKRFCANSEVGDLALEVYERTDGRWTHIRSLTSSGGAHLEFGRKSPFKELPVAF